MNVFRHECSNGNLDNVIEIHAQFNFTTDDVRLENNYAFRYACSNGHLSTAMWLVDTFGLGVVDAKNSRCIYWCFEHDNRIVLRWILKTFPDIDIPEKWKETLKKIQNEDVEDDRNFIKPCVNDIEQ